MAAVAIPLQLPIAAQELPQWHREQAAASYRTAGAQLLRLKLAVALLFLEELGQGLVVVVNQVLAQVASLAAVQPDHLVHGHGSVVASIAAVQQTQLVVRIPAGVAHDLAENVVEARDEVTVVLRTLDRLACFFSQLGSHPLVGIDEQDPVIGGHLHGGVALAREVIEEPSLHARAPEPARKLDRPVNAPAVQQEPLVRPAQRLETGDDVLLLVARDHGGGDAYHRRTSPATKKAAAASQPAMLTMAPTLKLAGSKRKMT